MIATLHRKDPASARKFSLFDVLHPGAIHADRQIMFLLASNCTGVTADALTIIDDEAVVHGKFIITLILERGRLSKKSVGARTSSPQKHCSSTSSLRAGMPRSH